MTENKDMSGFVIWMTGLSGSGKSTLATLLTTELLALGLHVECLDGDEVRKNLSHGLGFTREDRDRNIRRIGYVASMVARSGSCAITAAISPYRALRDEIRSKTDAFVEVYCECPLEVLTERDPKGLYKRALAGEIKNFTGVTDPYEAPTSPDVALRTDTSSPETCVKQIMEVLKEKGYLSLPDRLGARFPSPFGGNLTQASPVERTPELESDDALEIDAITLEATLAVARGYFSPLAGFMTEREAVKVEKSSALESGTPWWNEAFVLPVDSSVSVGEGDRLRLTRDGESIALVRVQQIWQDASGERRVAGPIEALFNTSEDAPPTARQVRDLLRKSGGTYVSCLFAQTAPSAHSLTQLATAVALSDSVIVACTASLRDDWSAALDSESDVPLVITLPKSFPLQNEQARLVVQRAVGASASQMLA